MTYNVFGELLNLA